MTSAVIVLPSARETRRRRRRDRGSRPPSRAAARSMPSAATSARCSMPYAPYFFSSPSRNAIHLPSGLHSSRDASAAAGGGRQRLLGRPGFGVGDEELARRLAIGILVTVAHEGDARAVGRPRRRRLVGTCPSSGDRASWSRCRTDRCSCDGPTADSPARPACTCSDRSRSASARARRGRPASRLAVGRISASGSGSPTTSASRLPVGRPLVGLQPALELGQLKRLAAVSIEQPDLIALRLARPRRRERQVLPVRAPPRRRLAFLAERDLPIVLAVEADHPDVRRALVFLHVDGARRRRRPSGRRASTADREPPPAERCRRASSG